MQHHYVEMASYLTAYRQRWTFNKSFSKGKTRHCKSIAERI